MKFKLPPSNDVSVPRHAIDILMRHGDGNAALLYLYIMSAADGGTLEDAQRVINLGRQPLKLAAEVLASLGLIVSEEFPDGAQAEPDDEDDKTESVRGGVTSEDRSQASDMAAGDPAFRTVAEEAQNVIGKPLSSDDFSRLAGIYTTLAMPPELIIHLLGYCAEETRRTRGDEKRPTIRYIEKAAYVWDREGIDSIEAAEKYIAMIDERRSDFSEILSVLQIKDRKPTKTERAYVEAWTEMGFRADAVAEAYDRTIIKTNRLSWNYLNSILKSWHEKGIHTPAEISAIDAPMHEKPNAKKANGHGGNGNGNGYGGKGVSGYNGDDAELLLGKLRAQNQNAQNESDDDDD